MNDSHSSPVTRTPIAQNVFVIQLHDSILTVLSLTIEIEANRVKVARIGTAYLHVSRWKQQLRQLFLGADASVMYLFESDSHSNSVMPSTSNAGNEYLDRKDSNECGIRFGSFSSNMRRRDALSSDLIGTPRSFTISAKESMSWSVFDIQADSKG
jgi:hypothetical protein